MWNAVLLKGQILDLNLLKFNIIRAECPGDQVYKLPSAETFSSLIGQGHNDCKQQWAGYGFRYSHR